MLFSFQLKDLMGDIMMIQLLTIGLFIVCMKLWVILDESMNNEDY